MFESFSTNFQEFTHNVRIVDFIDIALITVFLYLLLKWLRQSVSNRSIIGLAVLIVVYIFARATDMYLTERLIQGLFVVILIGVVVVFQTDIRRIVDRIGHWRFLKKNKQSYSNKSTDILTEAISAMAENRTGALIVLQGNETLERHIHGGIKLNGEISIPLLHSIFNPKSPGHDGAVIMEGSKIIRFGTHLPLSVNLGRESSGGTRHAAAMGMSEQTDALVIVVSEERGTISVGQSGKLTEIDPGLDLKNILTEFWNEHYEISDRSWIDWWKKRHLWTVITSFILATGLWFSFAYPTQITSMVAVPIEYRNLQENNIILQDSIPMKARLTLSGSEQAFRSLDPNDLSVSFDMSSEDITANELLITENNINLPENLELYEVSPQSLQIKARQFTEIQLPVQIPTSGSLPADLELVSMDSDPRSIYVLADTTTDPMPDSIAVEPVDLSEISESDTLSQSLDIPTTIKLSENTSDEILIIIEVQPESNS